MIEICPLKQLNLTDFQRIASGYTAECKYVVVHSEKEDKISFELQLVILDKPAVKKWHHYDETLQNYERVLSNNYSFGAYDGNLLVGLLIAEPHEWNRSVWVWEFHIEEKWRGMGIGKQLMDCVAAKAQTAGLRTIVCETQSTNATAIQIYGKLGFRMEGIDISYYSNHDYPDGEIAVFMKRRLE